MPSRSPDAAYVPFDPRGLVAAVDTWLDGNVSDAYKPLHAAAVEVAA